MTAVDIVYTSCHDAVRGWAGRAGPACSAPSFRPLQGRGGPGGAAAPCQEQVAKGPGVPSRPPRQREPLALLALPTAASRRVLAGQSRVDPSPHTLSVSTEWTSNPHAVLGLPGSSLWGKELWKEAARPWRGTASPPDVAGRAAALGADHRGKLGAGSLAGARGLAEADPLTRKEACLGHWPESGSIPGPLRLTSHPPPRCTKPPSTWQWITTRRRW